MSDRRVRAYIGLGGNVGDASATLTRAVTKLAAVPGISVRGVSPLYVTAPWGVTDQPDFHNAVVAIDVRGDREPTTAALELLAQLKELEREAGRRRGKRWGPRPLDLDLLVFGRHRIDAPRTPGTRSTEPDRRLVVPHRDASDRLFVLAPLADLAPRLVPPGWTGSVAARRREVAATEPPDAVQLVGRWDQGRGIWL